MLPTERKGDGCKPVLFLSFFFFFLVQKEMKRRRRGKGEDWAENLGQGDEKKRREKRKKREVFFFAFRWLACTGILATGRKQTKMASKLSALGQSFIPWSNDMTSLCPSWGLKARVLFVPLRLSFFAEDIWITSGHYRQPNTLGTESEIGQKSMVAESILLERAVDNRVWMWSGRRDDRDALDVRFFMPGLTPVHNLDLLWFYESGLAERQMYSPKTSTSERLPDDGRIPVSTSGMPTPSVKSTLPDDDKSRGNEVAGASLMPPPVGKKNRSASPTSEDDKSSGEETDLWTVYSARVCLPALLNDPSSGWRREADLFTQTWGEDFLPNAEVPPSTRLPYIGRHEITRHLKRIVQVPYSLIMLVLIGA